MKTAQEYLGMTVTDAVEELVQLDQREYDTAMINILAAAMSDTNLAFKAILIDDTTRQQRG